MYQPRPIITPNFPFFWQLLLLNVALTSNAIAMMVLWNWAVGWMFFLFISGSIALAIILQKMIDRLISEISGDRDRIALDQKSFEKEVIRETDKARGFKPAEILQEDGTMATSTQVFCQMCGSAHPLLEVNFFHPSLHLRLEEGESCFVPILRSRVERISLDLPDLEVYLQGKNNASSS